MTLRGRPGVGIYLFAHSTEAAAIANPHWAPPLWLLVVLIVGLVGEIWILNQLRRALARATIRRFDAE